MIKPGFERKAANDLLAAVRDGDVEGVVFLLDHGR
jgi:hypothetical protein